MLDNAGTACLANAILLVDSVLEKLNHELRTLCVTLKNFEKLWKSLCLFLVELNVLKKGVDQT